MNKERYDQIIDEVYTNYQDTHEYEPFILMGEMGLSKEEFVDMVTNKYGFGLLFGIQINETELSFEERYQILKNGDVGDWLAIHYKEPKTKEYFDKCNIPTKKITLNYKDENIEILK